MRVTMCTQALNDFEVRPTFPKSDVLGDPPSSVGKHAPASVEYASWKSSKRNGRKKIGFGTKLLTQGTVELYDRLARDEGRTPTLPNLRFREIRGNDAVPTVLVDVDLPRPLGVRSEDSVSSREGKIQNHTRNKSAHQSKFSSS